MISFTFSILHETAWMKFLTLGGGDVMWTYWIAVGGGNMGGHDSEHAILVCSCHGYCSL
jgi:hypothetical protein